MKERPMLMKGEMVRAILEGRKTQTRRLMKPQPPEDYSSLTGPEMYHPTVTDRSGEQRPGAEVYGVFSNDGEFGQACRFGQPGDRLWVRETHAIVPRTAYARSEGVQQLLRPDDNHDAAIFREGFDRSTGGIRWRPSIHMPRWASRITLEITDVRVERLQDISQRDAQEEGCEKPDLPPEVRGVAADFVADERTSFAILWNRINGRGSWDANPWVWVIEFRRVQEMEKAA